MHGDDRRAADRSPRRRIADEASDGGRGDPLAEEGAVADGTVVTLADIAQAVRAGPVNDRITSNTSDEPIVRERVISASRTGSGSCLR